MESEGAAFMRVADLTTAQKEYYGIRDIQGETVRKEVLIVQEYVVRHCEEELTWEILSEVADISPGYLRKLYRKWCCYRLRDYQNICRMKKAAVYLSETTRSVQEICHFVGMNNASYFSALFRQVHGVTPTTYRQMYG